MAEETDDDDGRERRQLRRLGVTTVLGGLAAIAADQVLTDPHEPLVAGLGFLAIASFVFEYTEDLESGLSLGFLSSGIILWLYPVLTPEPAFTFAGALLVVLGLVNVAFPPFALFFRNIGRRIGGGDRG
jgi:hypothetical protein